MRAHPNTCQISSCHVHATNYTKDKSSVLASLIKQAGNQTYDETFAVILSLCCDLVSGQVECVAHRGASLSAPENTLASTVKAIELGVDRVEMDVRQSKDGVLVLMHDARLERTTNGKGYLRDLSLIHI